MPAFKNRASTKTATLKAQIVSEAYSVRQAASLLNVTPGRIRQRLGEGTLLGVQVSGEWRLPQFQFTNHGVVPNLNSVLRSLPNESSLMATYAFFTSESVDLDEGDGPTSPLEWLSRGGDPGPVVEMAALLDRTA